MLDPTSRYYSIETAKMTMPDGRVIAYKRRRIVPSPEAMPVLAEVLITQGDRLDLIAARTLGEPEQFWRICDANNALDPEELTTVVGRIIRVPVPQI
jgi:hypothetical protein